MPPDAVKATDSATTGRQRRARRPPKASTRPLAARFRRGRVFFAIVALGLLASCGGCSDPVVVKKILVDVDAAAVADGVDREHVRAVVDDVIDESRGIRVDALGSERVLRVRVERLARTTGATVPPGQELPANHPPVTTTSAVTSTLALSVEVVENGRSLLRGSAFATMSGEAQTAALVDRALREALEQIEQASATERLATEELLVVLGSPSEAAQRKRRAMLTLAARRDLRATPLITPLLRHDDADTRAAALQALTLLSDPNAVAAIIDYSERQPAAVRRQCIDAVKATDSPLAAAWLFVLSTGHPDVDVQAHARAALAVLPPSARNDAAPDQVAVTAN
jgi:hypothetical protein